MTESSTRHPDLFIYPKLTGQQLERYCEQGYLNVEGS